MKNMNVLYIMLAVLSISQMIIVYKNNQKIHELNCQIRILQEQILQNGNHLKDMVKLISNILTEIEGVLSNR